MTNRIAIVTGGTRGIGKEISKALLKDGHKVVAIYGGNDDAAKLFKEETGADTLKLDVTDFDKCQKAIDTIQNKYKSVDILVNNAGITRDGMMHKMSLENWQSVIDTNLNSCFNMCRAIIPHMRTARWGRVINVSSINGQKGQLGQTNYSAAKAGMIGFTKALALENANRGITVNTISPGYINTDMTESMSHEILESIVKTIPIGRLGKAEEIADLVAYLSSDKASFITGANHSINGGQFMAG